MEGYFSVIQKCYRCRSAAVIVIFCILLLAGWYVMNVIVSRNVASLEMILQWAQLANIIGDINMNWTHMVTSLFGAANILDFDVDILEPSCLIRWGFKQNFLMQLALPFMMTFMSVSGYLGSSLAHLVIRHKLIKRDSAWMRPLYLFVDIPENEEQLKEKSDAVIATFLASVDIMYVTIAKYCFDVFKCENIAGISVLRVDPDVVCDKDHTLLVVLASLGIIFYVVGYPMCVSWKLYQLKYESSFSGSVNLRRYGFIYEKYELDYYFTPAISIVRKLLFVLVLVYVNNPAFQVGAIAIIINASLMIHVYTAPYVDTYLDVLFSFLLLALMFEAFGGLMFYSENLPAANREILEWIVLITFGMLVIVFVVIFAMEILDKYYIWCLKKQHRKFARGQMEAAEGSEAKSPVTSPIARKVLEHVNSRKLDKNISFELLDTFKPSFVHHCLSKDPDHIEGWDTLTNMLADYMSDQSDTSYLSIDPVAKFWRRLVDRFPEIVDFLAVADDETREKFNDIATNLYRNFYLSKKVTPLPLMDVLNWRDYAPMAQWLAIAPSEERKFFLDFISDLFETAGKKDAAEMLRSKLATGGPDPHLTQRSGSGSLSQKKKKILKHLTRGTHPFHHSAAEKRLRTMTTVAVGVSKFRMNRHRSKKKLDQILSNAATETVASSSYVSEGSARIEPAEANLNNQSSFRSEDSAQSNTVNFQTEIQISQ